MSTRMLDLVLCIRNTTIVMCTIYSMIVKDEDLNFPQYHFSGQESQILHFVMILNGIKQMAQRICYEDLILKLLSMNIKKMDSIYFDYKKFLKFVKTCIKLEFDIDESYDDISVNLQIKLLEARMKMWNFNNRVGKIGLNICNVEEHQTNMYKVVIDILRECDVNRRLSTKKKVNESDIDFLWRKQKNNEEIKKYDEVIDEIVEYFLNDIDIKEKVTYITKIIIEKRNDLIQCLNKIKQITLSKKHTNMQMNKLWYDIEQLFDIQKLKNKLLSSMSNIKVIPGIENEEIKFILSQITQINKFENNESCDDQIQMDERKTFIQYIIDDKIIILSQQIKINDKHQINIKKILDLSNLKKLNKEVMENDFDDICFDYLLDFDNIVKNLYEKIARNGSDMKNRSKDSQVSKVNVELKLNRILSGEEIITLDESILSASKPIIELFEMKGMIDLLSHQTKESLIGAKINYKGYTEITANNVQNLRWNIINPSFVDEVIKKYQICIKSIGPHTLHNHHYCRCQKCYTTKEQCLLFNDEGLRNSGRCRCCKDGRNGKKHVLCSHICCIDCENCKNQQECATFKQMKIEISQEHMKECSIDCEYCKIGEKRKCQKYQNELQDGKLLCKTSKTFGTCSGISNCSCERHIHCDCINCMSREYKIDFLLTYNPKQMNIQEMIKRKLINFKCVALEDNFIISGQLSFFEVSTNKNDIDLNFYEVFMDNTRKMIKLDFVKDFSRHQIVKTNDEIFNSTLIEFKLNNKIKGNIQIQIQSKHTKNQFVFEMKRNENEFWVLHEDKKRKFEEIQNLENKNIDLGEMYENSFLEKTMIKMKKLMEGRQKYNSHELLVSMIHHTFVD